MVPPASIPTFEYTLYGTDPNDFFVHPEWTLSLGNSDMNGLCGDIEYEVPEITAITASGGTFAYDADSRKITIYSTDRLLIGAQSYDVIGKLKNYPSI